MQLKPLASAALVLSLLVPDSLVLARGGRGGGGGGFGGGAGGGARAAGGGAGGQRGGGGAGGFSGAGGGGPRGGGSPGAGGGFGGGLSSHGGSGRAPGGSAAMGPFGHEGSGGAGPRPGMGSAGGSGARPGMGAGGPASGVGARPGMGAGGAGGPASGIGARPGMGAGGAGGPASGIGVRPGMGAGGAGGPASGIGVRPGMGAGDVGAPGDYAARAATTGTYYHSNAAYAAQTEAFRGAAAAYPAYGAALYGGFPNAWAPRNLTSVSVYNNPGYGALAATMGLAARPLPYDYGGNVVAQTSTVYVNGDNAGTPEEYTEQASQLAGTGQSVQPDDDAQWLPLGVFAIVEGEQTNSNDTFQLAVNAQGILRGNYHNIPSNDVENLSGSVDKTTQRAAWTIGSDKYPIYEAGIANLTKDATPLLIHTAPGQTRQMSLIRLSQPPQ